MIKAINKLIRTKKEADPDFSAKGISDGYHTFDELYAYRKAYNAMLFNTWAEMKENYNGGIRVKHNVHKSMRHHDGEPCFGGGYFVVIAELPTGQISNHYKLKYWNDFEVPVEYKSLVKYDGHTSEEALERMEAYIRMQ